MLRAYLLTSFRNLRRDPAYAAINISGFALAIACCILILLQVFSELRFDRFHANADRLYRVLYEQTGPRGHQTFAGTMLPLAAALRQDFPSVVASAQFVRGLRLTAKREFAITEGIISRNYFFSDDDVFRMFDFPFRSGDPSSALREPGTVVLTHTIAQQLFGNEDPVGKRLYLEAEDFPEFGTSPYVVTGVLQPIPVTSHIQFDFLVSRSTLGRFEMTRDWLTDWDNYLAATYILLNEASSAADISARMEEFTNTHALKEEGYTKGFTLQPMADVHFGSAHVGFEMNANEGDIMYVRLFGLLAVFIAGIACVNYINLSTARAIRRAREIAVRKVIGARRSEIARQFLAEALLHSCIAFLVAVGLVEAVLPAFNDMAGTSISFASALSPGFVLSLIGLAGGMGIIAGLYPAVVLSRTSPNAVFRGESAAGRGGARIRNVLVVVQFTVTIVMIVATLIVVQQMEFATQKDLGFSNERLLVFDINSDDVQENFRTVKAELAKSSLIRSVTVSSRVPGDWKGFRRTNARPAEKPDANQVRIAFNAIDEDFLGTYQIDLVQGRNLDRSLASDSNAILINQTAARSLFDGSPIGQRLSFSSTDFVGVVVGVVNDFHIMSLHDAIEPLVLGYIPDGGRHALHGIDYFTIRASGPTDEVVSFVTSVHEQFDRINPIELGFLDEWWSNLYERDERLGRVFATAAGIAILIACIGLLGLSAFMAALRTKEIGVRKVLGASTGSLIALLSRDFSILIGIGFLAACPLAYFAMKSWLEGFSYRIEIGWMVFAVAGFLAFGLAFVVVGYQALRAAHANPVESLRYE